MLNLIWLHAVVQGEVLLEIPPKGPLHINVENVEWRSIHTYTLEIEPNQLKS